MLTGWEYAWGPQLLSLVIDPQKETKISDRSTKHIDVNDQSLVSPFFSIANVSSGMFSHWEIVDSTQLFGDDFPHPKNPLGIEKSYLDWFNGLV